MKTNLNIAEEMTGELGHVGQRTKTNYCENVTKLCRRDNVDVVWDGACVVRWAFVDGSRLVVAMSWWALGEDYDG